MISVHVHVNDIIPTCRTIRVDLPVAAAVTVWTDGGLTNADVTRWTVTVELNRR